MTITTTTTTTMIGSQAGKEREYIHVSKT